MREWKEEKSEKSKKWLSTLNIFNERDCKGLFLHLKQFPIFLILL
jgi:hypothetical protein